MTAQQRILATITAALLVVVLGGSVAAAAWMSTAAGMAQAAALGMPQGQTPTATVEGTTVTLSFAANLLGGNVITTYTIKRYGADAAAEEGVATVEGEEGSTPDPGVLANEFACESTAPTGDPLTVTCQEAGVAEGSWRYTVTPTFQNWIGTESGVLVDPVGIAPAAPSDVAAVAAATAITVTWTNSSTSAESYEVHVSTTGSDGSYVLLGADDASPFVHAGLACGQTRHYRIVAVNPSNPAGAQRSAFSAPASATTAACAVAPDAPVISQKPDSPTAATTADFAFSSTGAVGFDCKLNGGDFTPCDEGTASYTGLAAATHSFSVRARNTAGTSAPTSYTWTVQTQVPGNPSITQQPAEFSTNPEATFHFTSSQATSFLCQVDNAAAEPCTSPFIATVDDGTHTFTVQGVNVAGASTSAQATWTVDRVAPTITFSGMPAGRNAAGWYRADIVLVWTCTDGTGSGVVAGTVSQTLTVEHTGDTATGICTDKAGNTKSDVQTGIKLDKTAPVTTDNTSTIGSAWRNTDAAVVLTPDAALSGAKATYSTIDGSTPTTSSTQGTSFTVAPAAGTATTFTVKYFTVDNADNVEAVKTGTQIRIDKKAPTAALLTPAAGSIRNGQALTASATDDHSGVASVAYLYCAGTSCTPTTSVGASSTAAGNYPLTWASQPADGSYRLAAQVTDLAGNVTLTAPVTITIDNTVPTVSSITSTNQNGTIASGDTFSATFSEPISAASLPNPLTQKMTITNPLSGNTTMTIPGLTDGAINMGSTTWVKNKKTIEYNGTLALSGDGRTVTFTVGTCATSCGDDATGISGTLSFVPSSSLRDLAGNAPSSTVVTYEARLF